MRDTVDADGLVDAINRQLALLPTDAQTVLDEEGNTLANRSRRDLRETSPRNRPRYHKGWAIRKEDRADGMLYRIYNRTDWQVTHLLEHGYLQHGTGRRVGQRVHIAPVNRQIEQLYPEMVRIGLTRKIK